MTNLDEPQQDSQQQASLLEQRRSLYDIYQTEEEMKDAMERYGVVALSLSPASTTATTTESSTLATSPRDSNSTTLASSGRGKDIWGRYPSKEPKELVPCPVCARSVSSLKFAPHLDRCMGIGNTTRAAAAANAHAPPALTMMNMNAHSHSM